jgi:diaminopropionate ammonia-lyase
MVDNIDGGYDVTFRVLQAFRSDPCVCPPNQNLYQATSIDRLARRRNSAMLIRNTGCNYGEPLDAREAEALSMAAASEVERFLQHHSDYQPTPLHHLSALSRDLSVGAISVKDEGHRLGLGSFKALGGAYALIRLVLEEGERRLGRPLDFTDLSSSELRAVAAEMTFGCATDGNHGRSVAYGAHLVGARATIFVHQGVSAGRIAAMARYGAHVVTLPGTYDDSVAEAARVCAERGWTILSDTSWAGYERIPSLVMQGYTAIASEALRQMSRPPTHIFIQAGVGGIAAALAGHFAIRLGDERPTLVVVEPARAACLFETAKAGRPIRIEPSEPTVMAMLECYEPSLIAWRVLSRAADAFMTVEDEDAVAAMIRLARPADGDPAIVAGESGGAGLAGLIRAAGNERWREMLGLGPTARVLLINTEGATDPERYRELTGLDAASVGQVA